MDGHQLDTIARALGATGPRRRVLAGVLSVALAGALGRHDVTARPRSKHHRRHPVKAQKGSKSQGDDNDQGDTPKPDGLPCKKHAQCQSGHCCDFTKRKPGTCQACCPDACPSGQCLTCGAAHTCVSSCSAPQTCGGGGTPGVCGVICQSGSCPVCQTCVDGRRCDPVPNQTVACNGSSLSQNACTTTAGTGVCRDGACFCGAADYDATTNRCVCNATAAEFCRRVVGVGCAVSEVCANGGTGMPCR